MDSRYDTPDKDYTERQTFAAGDRIELHPGCDLWMCGARFGTVTGTSITSGDAVRFTLDATKSKVWTAPVDRLRHVR